MSNPRSFAPLAGALAVLLAGGAPILAQAPKAKTAEAPKTRKAAPAKALPAPVKVTSVEGITEYRLANGLRVLLFPDPSKPTMTVNITYLVGSRNEHYGETGMAHLLEHLQFKGTDQHPDVPKILNGLGARFNGTTSYDRTNYFVSFPASEANLTTALSLEADRMTHSHIWKKDLWNDETQKGEMTVVRNEFEMGENNPVNVTLERTLAKAFDWHSYGKSTIGARSDIENVNIERLQAFYHTYYQPDNATLLVAGKIDEAKTLDEVNRFFGPIPKPTRTIQKTYTLDPTQDGERSVTVRRVGDIQALMAAYKVPAGSDPEFAAIQVYAQALSDAPSGRLYKALVEPKKAAEVFAYPADLREPGFVLFGAVVPKDANLEDARETLLKGIEQTAAAPFTAEEVERAKKALLKEVDLVLNQSDRLGVGLSEYVAQGDWRLFFLQRDRVKAVTTQDVQKVADAYFKQSNRTVGQFIPTAKPDRAEIPAMKDVAAMVKDYKGQAAVAKGEAFDTAPAAIEARIQRFTTDAGLKAAFIPKKTRGETVSVSLRLNLGDEKALMNQRTTADLAASMLLRGTAKHDRQQLKDELDRLKAQVWIDGNPTARVNVSITTVRQNLPEVLKLVVEALREPSFPAKEFETLVQEEITGLEDQRSEPTYQASVTLQRHMAAQFPKGHPNYMPSFEEQMAELKAAKAEDLQAFHRNLYGASAADLAIVGDFDAPATKALVTELLGSWKAATPYTRVPWPFANASSINQSLETPDKANAFFVAAETFPMRDDDPDYPAMVLGNYMLGGGALKSRLADRIRQKEGISYGVGSQFNAHPEDKSASWSAYAILNPANMGKLEVAFQEELARALKDGFTAEEIQTAKHAWLQAQEVSRAQDRELAGRLAANLELGRTLAFQADLEKKVQALNGEQILTVLRKYLEPGKLSIVKAGDFKKAATK